MVSKIVRVLQILLSEVAEFLKMLYPENEDVSHVDNYETPNLKALKTPIRLSDFDRLKLIGDGTFGTVYQIQHKGTSQIFALKVVANPKTEAHRNHLEDEKRVLRNLKSPFICEMLHYFKTDLKHYFVLEFFAGGDMFHLVEQKSKLSEATARFYLAEFALGLEFLHSHDVAHRDLKTENLMLDVRGHVKIIDFGLCKILRRGDKTDTFCGTHRFMAPEILRRKEYDHSVDLWSYGAVMFEMFTGRELIQGNNVTERNEKVMAGIFEFPRFMTQNTISLLNGLLQCNPLRRITIEDLKKSAFFGRMDWEKMEAGQCEPPIKPKIKNDQDVSQFDKRIVQKQVLQSPQKHDVVEEEENDPFAGFDFNELLEKGTAAPAKDKSSKKAAKKLFASCN